ncbi:MAG: KaiC domain-containing protein [Halobacteria archaeon]|nr:KaiC domain-containing protein [Halobacteria archaeon]
MSDEGDEDFGFGEFGDDEGNTEEEPEPELERVDDEAGDLGDPDDWFPDVTKGKDKGDEEGLRVGENRIRTGVNGLDEMIDRGIPRGSMIATVGSPGTGKTTFGMQFIHEGLSNGEKCVFFALEQTEDSVRSTADSMGWEFSRYEDEGSLEIVHMNPVEVATSLNSIRNELPRMLTDFGASRVVFDSVTLIEMMFDTAGERRNQVFRFGKSLKDAGITVLMTSEASDDDAYKSKYGIIEYLADAFVVLRYVREEGGSGTRMAVEIVKIRDTSHSRSIRPYELTSEGIEVYSRASIF